MAIINNYEQIKKLLKFDDPDKFYFIQLLKRPTDGHTVSSHGINVGNFFVSNQEYFDKKWPLIIEMCEYFGARAYIRLNRRSHRQTSLKNAQLILKYIDNNTPELTRKTFLRTCGKWNAESKETKTWIVDIDTAEQIHNINIIQYDIDNCKPESINSKIIDVIPTNKGYHIISRPFDLKQFKETCQYAFGLDVHKDNPTLLYRPDIKNNNV